jgi:hypothetical protein
MIVDKQARKLLTCDPPVLTAYSIGICGPVIKADPSGRARGGIIVDAQEITELSIVDAPSNVGCGITLLKRAPDGRPVWVERPFVAKGKKHKRDAPLIMCTRDGTQLDAGERFCTGCGKKNPHYLQLADRKLPMNKKGARVKGKKYRKRMAALKRWQRVDALTKAAGSAFPVYTEGQALRVMLAGFLDDPCPDTRIAAASALERLAG